MILLDLSAADPLRVEKTYGYCALHFAAAHGRFEALKELLGACVDKRGAVRQKVQAGEDVSGYCGTGRSHSICLHTCCSPGTARRDPTPGFTNTSSLP